MRKFIKKKPNLMVLTALILIFLSLSAIVLLALFKLPRLEMWYDKYLVYLEILENRIASMDGKWIIIVSIFSLFILKALIPLPILPLSCICVISGMVFITPVSLLINLLGVMIMFSIRYYFGTKRKTFPYRFLKNYDDIWSILEHDGNGNPWLLFVCRLIPLFPINTVSNIYGSLKYEFKNYMIISSVGFLPKIISYSIIGRNAFNPFSASFLVPVIILFMVSGIGLLLTRRIILFIKRKDR